MPEKRNNSKDKIRAFIAIPLPDSITLWMTRIQQQLKSAGLHASWPKSDSMHLTLKFLGPVSMDQIEPICDCLTTVSNQCTAFSLHGTGVGIFPSVKRARVLWAGIGGRTDALEVLFRSIEDHLYTALGIKKEDRRFSAHLTLARLKKPVPPRQAVSYLRMFEGQSSETFCVDQVDLMKSDLLASGAVHKVLFSIKLNER